MASSMAFSSAVLCRSGANDTPRLSDEGAVADAETCCSVTDCARALGSDLLVTWAHFGQRTAGASPGIWSLVLHFTHVTCRGGGGAACAPSWWILLQAGQLMTGVPSLVEMIALHLELSQVMIMFATPQCWHPCRYECTCEYPRGCVE